MTVCVGLINTRVIKATEIPGRIALRMTHSQKDRSLPAKKKYIWWEETDVTKCIDASERHPEIAISGALRIWHRSGKPSPLIPWQWIHLLHKLMYWKICLRLQRAWSNTTNCGIHCIHFYVAWDISAVEFAEAWFSTNLLLFIGAWRTCPEPPLARQLFLWGFEEGRAPLATAAPGILRPILQEHVCTRLAQRVGDMLLNLTRSSFISVAHTLKEVCKVTAYLMTRRNFWTAYTDECQKLLKIIINLQQIFSSMNQQHVCVWKMGKEQQISW